MKRFLALVLVLALVLAPAAVFAEDPVTEDPDTQGPTAVVVKNLEVGQGRVNPAEAFVFKFTNPSPATAPAIPDVTISYDTGVNGVETGALNLDGFANAAIGRYQYEVKEIGGSTAGMVYSERVGTLIVDKESDGTVKSYIIIGTMGSPEAKHENFTNTFTAWDLDVTKKVTGNLGDKAKEFTLTVTLKAPEGKIVKVDSITVLKNSVATETAVNFDENGVATLTLTVKDSDTYKIADLPDGVTYTVVEDGVDEGGKVDEYTVTYEGATGTMTEDKVVTVTNHKSSQVPTGITLDNMPYIILMAVALVGLGAFALRKRAQN